MSKFDLPDESTINQFVLTKSKVAMRLPVDSYTVQAMEVSVDTFTQSLFDEMVYKLESYVLQDKLPPKTVEETYTFASKMNPVTWWDHFKVEKLATSKWYWRWLGKLKPPMFEVETKDVTLRVDLERWISYPEAQNIPETFGRQYRGYNVKSSLWD